MEEIRKIDSYKDLIVWQKAMELVKEIYNLTGEYPQSEVYGLTSQMRKSSISIPSNIAEGRRRGSRKDFGNFLIIAFGSGAELETQIEIGKQLSFSKGLNYTKVEILLDEVMKILNTMIKKLQATS